MTLFFIDYLLPIPRRRRYHLKVSPVLALQVAGRRDKRGGGEGRGGDGGGGAGVTSVLRLWLPVGALVPAAAVAADVEGDGGEDHEEDDEDRDGEDDDKVEGEADLPEAAAPLVLGQVDVLDESPAGRAAVA